MGSGRNLTTQRVYLLRFSACPPRRDLFEAGRGCTAFARCSGAGWSGERWNAIVAAAVALTATPVAFGTSPVAQFRAVGLDDAEIVDTNNAAVFFNWANRLMLSLWVNPASPPIIHAIRTLRHSDPGRAHVTIPGRMPVAEYQVPNAAEPEPIGLV